MKYVRIKLPFRSPEKTLILAKKLSEKHTALGAASPLTGFADMAAFEAHRANAAQLQEEGDDADSIAQGKYHQVMQLCGIAKGQNRQNENSVYWFVLQSRDVLRVKHRGVEQALEEYGFSVVISQTGARKNVRVKVPVANPAHLLALAEDIINKHAAMGASSPLTTHVNMGLFASTVANAAILLSEWDTQRSLSQSKHNQALNIIGYGIGQTSQTEGTLFYDLITVRDRLLQVTSGAEEQMQEWGFEVVIK